MGKGNKSDFILNDENDVVEKELSSEANQPTFDINEDKIFRKYANKSLPLNKKKSRAGLTPYQGAFTKKHKTHLLRRLTFGSTLGNMQSLNGITADQAVDAMITKNAVAPAPPINYYENFYPDSALVPYGQTWVGAERYVGSTRAYRIYSLKGWWLDNMMHQDMTIEEKMILFFHSQYPIEMYNASGRPNFQYHHVELFRKHCLGNLKDFVKELTIDGAMLWYLNGRVNTKTAPDENYARELQELFTVGKEGNTFNEPDVLAAAKVLTGWRTREKTAASPTTPWEVYFSAGSHDTTTKTFSSYYNNATISPDNSNPAGYGANEVDDLVDMIFTHGAQDIAKLFVRRLYRFFVYYDIDATVESTIITPLAQTLINGNWEIEPVLKQLFKSDHFFDVANMDCIIKSPIEYFIGLFRNMNFEIPATATHEHRGSFFQRLNNNYLALNSQSLGDPPNVSGWPSSYQIPFFNQIWMNTDTAPKRMVYTDYFMRSAGAYVRPGVYFKIDLIGLVEDIELTLAPPVTSVSDPNVLISEFVDIFLGVGLSQASKDYYKTILLSGQSSDFYWTFAWNDYKANPTNVTFRNIVETRLRNMFTEMLRLPEHHLA